MKSTMRSFVLLFLLGSLGYAQELTVTVSPNPAPLGAPITVTCQATSPNLQTPGGCLVTSIRAGSTTGPVVRLFPCTFLWVAIPVYGSPTSRTMTWNQAVNTSYSPTGLATPGVYYFEIARQSAPNGGPISVEWFPVTIHDPVNNPVPALSAVNTPNFGSVFQMSLDAGYGHPAEAYAVGFSLTTNVGIPYAGGVASLDYDWVLQLSLTFDPNYFVNTTGTLDNYGVSPAIGLMIPPVVGTLVIPLHAQAVVFPVAGGLLLSNTLNIHVH